jgi:Ca2+-binding RTX toxin-like protein
MDQSSAFNFSGSDLIIVDLGVKVTDDSVGGFGVCNSLFLGAQLTNLGIINASGTGVFFGGQDCLIWNAHSGNIGGEIGVELGQASETVDNLGHITGGGGTGVLLDPGSIAAINNFGTIFSDAAAGVTDRSIGDGSTIYNAGVIDGVVDGVDIQTAFGVLAINNTADGTIQGHHHGIEIEIGAISLNNYGAIKNGIYDHGSGENTIVNQGTISGGIIFGDGNNIYQGAGGTVDKITCGAGGNQIALGNGNATVSLADGSDKVTAGSGEDTFNFTSYLHVDRIFGFNPHLDHIALSRGAFADLVGHHGVLASTDFVIGSHPLTWAEHIGYNAHNSFLFYDPDGSGPAHKIHFATLDPHLHLTAHDFLISA